MKVSNSDVLKIFNNNLNDLCNTVIGYFPDDKDLNVTNLYLKKILKINPSLGLKIWDRYVDKPNNICEPNDINSFFKDDYSSYLKNTIGASRIIKHINTIKLSVEKLSDNQKKNVIKYLNNLNQIILIFNHNRLNK